MLNQDTKTKKEEPTEPWRPVAQLITPQKEGMRRRWNSRKKMSRKLAEGWTLVVGEDPTEKTIIDGTQLDSNINKRELILCEMPEAKAKQRDAYYKQQADLAETQSVAEFKKKFPGKETYGSIEKEEI